tara:strand:- start:4737 stop:5330 length:594 start_codon:yes stop_codon:yes gene_type:complete
MILDRNIKYKYQSLYFPAAAFDWKPGSADNQDAGDGNDDLVEVGTTGFVGWKFDADPSDDQVFITMPTPTNVDWDNDVFYRVIWAAATSSDLSLTESFAISAAEVAFGAAPATSAPTAFATVSDTPSAINVPLATPWAKANSSTTDGIAGTSDILRVFVDCTTDTANDPRLIGLELKYLPKLTDGAQHKLTTDPTDA